MTTHYFDCPHCWEQQVKMIDPSLSEQTFIEDCEVCCNPLEFHLQLEGHTVLSFSVQPIGQ